MFGLKKKRRSRIKIELKKKGGKQEEDWIGVKKGDISCRN